MAEVELPAAEPPGAGRGRSSEVTLALLVALAVAAFTGTAAWVISQAYTSIMAEAESRNGRLVQRLDEAAGRFFRQQEHAAVHIAGDALKLRTGPSDAGSEFREHVSREHADLPMTLGVVDDRGKVVLATDDRLRLLLEQLVVSEPALFHLPEGGENTSLFILRPAAESVLPPAPILLGWRVVGAEGGFAVVVSAVDSDQLQVLVAGPSGVGAAGVGLVTPEGDLLFESSEGKRGGVSDIIRQILSPIRLREGGFGSYRGMLEPDGREGLVAYRRVGRFPVVAVSAVERAEVLRPWRSLVVAGIVIVLGLTVTVVVLAVLHIRSVGRSRRDLERRVQERTREQQRATERLMAAERLTHLGHWEHDLVTGQGFWSKEIHSLLGLAPGEHQLDMVGLLNAVHPGDRDTECTARILATAGVKPYDIQYRIVRADGTIRHVHAQAEVLRDDHDQPVRLIGTILDITARKQAESELRLLTRAIEQSPLSVVITDREGRIEYVNPHFTIASGYGFEEVVGRYPSIFKSGYTSPEGYRKLWEAIVSGKTWQGEFHNRMKNGDLHWESASIAPVRDEDGVIRHFVGVKEDITRRKLAEIELLAAKERAEAASLAKTRFLATISHELRTPLIAILGFSEMIKEGCRDEIESDRHADYARHIHSNGTHLLGLINDLLDLAKIEAGRFELHETLFDVEEIVFEAIEVVRSRAEAGCLVLRAEIAPHLPLLRGDDRATRHILINLLSNAIKFTPEGGEVTVGACLDGLGQFAVSVADTGIGIAAEDIPRIQEPFCQVDTALSRRHDGTGLGLPLCRNLIEMHGGCLELVSALGVGTTVTVRFPRERIVAAVAPAVRGAAGEAPS